MLSSERHDQILRTVIGRPALSVEQACDLTGASPATIRRDFSELADRGLLQRVRGGVKAVQSDAMVPFALREHAYSREKEALARRAAQLLQPNDVVIIDGGTTTYHLADCLPHFPLRVITNSLRLASVLDSAGRRRDGMEIFLAGGYLYPNSALLVGPGAQASLAQYRAGWAFLSVGGISEGGLSNTNELVVETERRMIDSADRVAILADPSKIGRNAMCHVCNLDAIDLLITNRSPQTAGPLDRIRAVGVEVIAV